MLEEKNFKLVIQYDGRPFVGWQVQPNGPSVQAVLEETLEKITGARPHVQGSGRTDTGVHAHGQVANVKLRTKLSSRTIKKALNATLPREIRIASVRRVSDEFHARFSAKEKTYRYLIITGKVRSPFSPWYAFWYKYSLSLDLMRKAAEYLKGEHDFASFMAAGSDVKTTVRTIKTLKISKGGGIISFTITGNGFLRHMVRNIVGTLILVGQGKIEPEEMKTILESRNRSNAGPTAPADGLSLLNVSY